MKLGVIQDLGKEVEMITKAVDEDCLVDIIYFDFRKAFDIVPHYRLLHKLKSMGINKNTFLWIKYFLSERRQRVVINGVKSQWGAVKWCSTGICFRSYSLFDLCV